MKKVGILILFAVFLMNCKKEVQLDYASFGATFNSEGAISKEAMMSKFENLQPGDSIEVTFESKVNKVCKAKGCWMQLDLGDDLESMVKFKDYGFFVPLNSEEREVIVHGKAFVKEVSVSELQHYAKDEGKSEEEIAAITEAKRTYSFLADGVLMAK
ncbi:hypothetical protein KH5_06100 [Urechidicola sp. KH5]